MSLNPVFKPMVRRGHRDMIVPLHHRLVASGWIVTVWGEAEDCFALCIWGECK
jgi:hypothetical protein